VPNSGGTEGGHDPCPAAIFTGYNDVTGVFPPNVLLCFFTETMVRHVVAAFSEGKTPVFATFCRPLASQGQPGGVVVLKQLVADVQKPAPGMGPAGAVVRTAYWMVTS
jgi:hypothetical protein